MKILNFTRQRFLLETDTAKNFFARMLGLAIRRSCPKNGLLFEFKSKRNPKIWMWGMRFPIDIVWISDSKVVKIEENVSAPRCWVLSMFFPYFLKKYSSEENVDCILEIESGFCKERGVKVGDLVADSRGQTSVDYILVLVVLALAIGVLFGNERLKSAFENLYSTVSTRVLSPGVIAP